MNVSEVKVVKVFGEVLEITGSYASHDRFLLMTLLAYLNTVFFAIKHKE